MADLVCFAKIDELMPWNVAYDTCKNVTGNLVGAAKTFIGHWRFVAMYLYMTMENLYQAWAGPCSIGML